MRAKTLYIIIAVTGIAGSCLCAALNITPMLGDSASVVSSTSNVRIISAVADVRARGLDMRQMVTIHVRNDGDATAQIVKVWADCYYDGKVVATEWMPTEPYHLAPGQESVREVWFDKGIECDSVRTRVSKR